MSDLKPKRPSREPVRSEAAAIGAPLAATAPIIEPVAAPEAESVSAIPVGIASVAVTEATTSIAVAEPAMPVAVTDPATSVAVTEPVDPAKAAGDAWGALAEAQAAFARSCELAAVEISGMSRSGIGATADAALALLGAKTYAEAIAINASLARRGIDTMLEGSARLSEIGVKAVADASRPLLSRFAGAWSLTQTG